MLIPKLTYGENGKPVWSKKVGQRGADPAVSRKNLAVIVLWSPWGVGQIFNELAVRGARGAWALGFFGGPGKSQEKRSEKFPTHPMCTAKALAPTDGQLPRTRTYKFVHRTRFQ